MATGPRDWIEWHAGYDRDSPLRARLAIVQRRIREVLDAAPPGPLRIVSMCAGQGRDLLGALDGHARAPDVRARLVELDPRLASAARAAAPRGVEVVCGDASSTDAYAGAVPADVVLVCGVFGNVADTDIERTVALLPSLCAPGATVVWTRHRRPPDRTVDIRRWFGDAGFDEVAFDGPDGFVFSVGVHRLARPPDPFAPGRRLFTFVGFDALRERRPDPAQPR